MTSTRTKGIAAKIASKTEEVNLNTSLTNILSIAKFFFCFLATNLLKQEYHYRSLRALRTLRSFTSSITGPQREALSSLLV